MKGPGMCLSWAPRGLPLMGHTGVCSNSPLVAHVFCLSRYLHGTRMKPMQVWHLYCPCLVRVGLPIMRPMWDATNRAHWSLQQFAMWGLRALPLETPSSQVIKRSAQLECNSKASPWEIHMWSQGSALLQPQVSGRSLDIRAEHLRWHTLIWKRTKDLP